MFEMKEPRHPELAKDLPSQFGDTHKTRYHLKRKLIYSNIQLNWCMLIGAAPF